MQKLEFDELYQGLTRPPMVGGVTEVYAVLMMVVLVTVYVGLGGGTGLLAVFILAGPVYLFGYLMCMRDARIFEIWLCRMRYFSVANRGHKHWNGPGMEPF